MNREVAPGALEEVLGDLSYPALRTDAATELSEVRVRVDDRQVNLGAVVDDAGADVFRAPEELLAAVRDALGEERPE